MPQETALYNEFTIGETMSYYGRLNLMSFHQIRERTRFLLDFLTLPDKSRRVNALSGGQRRRVSFAVALLHEPDLLILDEPTVGVDPLLRTRIWKHLLEIVGGVDVNGRKTTTIIITTHYIEEARQAHRVGLMRSGQLLAEASPNSLLTTYGKDSLEDVFLDLCQKQQQLISGTSPTKSGSRLINSSGVVNNDGDGDDDDDDDDDDSIPSVPPSPITHIAVVHHSSSGGAECGVCPLDERTPLLSSQTGHTTPNSHLEPICVKPAFFSFTKFAALVIKDMIKMKRNIGMLLFQFLIPAVQITLFCTCIGKDPHGLQVAVYNEETDTTLLGGQYLWHLDNDTITQVKVSSRAQGLEYVTHAKAWATLYIPQNFSQDLVKRMVPSGEIDNQTLYGSTIHVNMDMTNKQISVMIQEKLLSGFQSFSKDALNSLHLNPGLAELPVQIEEPVYGELDFSFTNFMAPGIILSTAYFLAVGLTALSFVIEKKEGLLDRTWTTGVSAVEIMLAHFSAQLLILCVQVAVLFTCVFLIFQVPVEGSMILVIILSLIQGFTGMMYGLTISALCKDETSVIQVALASFYPNLTLSGIIWPIQSMPQFLQYVSLALPQTLAAEALRCILGRGWGLQHPQVYTGFLVTLAWLSFFFTTAVILVRVKKYT